MQLQGFTTARRRRFLFACLKILHSTLRRKAFVFCLFFYSSAHWLISGRSSISCSSGVWGAPRWRLILAALFRVEWRFLPKMNSMRSDHKSRPFRRVNPVLLAPATTTARKFVSRGTHSCQWHHIYSYYRALLCLKTFTIDIDMIISKLQWSPFVMTLCFANCTSHICFDPKSYIISMWS